MRPYLNKGELTLKIKPETVLLSTLDFRDFANNCVDNVHGFVFLDDNIKTFLVTLQILFNLKEKVKFYQGHCLDSIIFPAFLVT